MSFSFRFRHHWTAGLATCLAAVALTACGGGSGNTDYVDTDGPNATSETSSTSPDDATTNTGSSASTETATDTSDTNPTNTTEDPPAIDTSSAPVEDDQVRLVLKRGSEDIPIVGAPIFPDAFGQSTIGDTDNKGEYTIGTETVYVELYHQRLGPFSGGEAINQYSLAQKYCESISNTTTDCALNSARNLSQLFLSYDPDKNSDNGIGINPEMSRFSASLDAPADDFEQQLGKTLAALGRQVAVLYQPMLGINLEEPQPEADDVGGQPLPFVDLFRIGRPFKEYSCTQIVYDEFGWPIEIPPECDTENHSILKTPSYATTLILRYLPAGTLPAGDYTVLYDGSGTLEYSGIGSKDVGKSRPGRDILTMTDQSLQERAPAGLRLIIKSTDQTNPIRNIRVVMPGGSCRDNPFVRVNDGSECPAGDYLDFAETLALDRNAIIFNPAFMRFLKDFKVVRTMNFMKASPRNPCYEFQDEEEYTNCILQDFEWSDRARMDDAMWGGSFRSPLAERGGKGVPLPVTVALLNQLNRDGWFNIPHHATDDYVREYARFVRDNLDADLKIYLEYTNEPWNDPFWGSAYVREKGKPLHDNLYWGGMNYYAKRAVEIFTIWQEEFGDTERFVRVLNTQHNGGEWTSRNMLNYDGTFQNVDAIASAPYFYGCWDRKPMRCQDPETTPNLMSEITSVDDIFDIIDNPSDPYGLAATISEMKIQKQVADDFKVDLISYEGGQHLTVHWGDAALSSEKKRSLLDLFRAANRDPRMMGRYSQFLTGWKEAGGKLFTLYTMPQTYHAFGSFGIKEYLHQSRKAAPKYDMSMQFQEGLGTCWWCEQQ